MMRKRLATLNVLPVTFSAGVMAALISSATAEPMLEEVLVTATFRAESLQDVPVSVNAVSGEKMLEIGIDKIEDLQAYVPNLSMSETGIGTNIYIRGIGSGINPGFEQSVGMYFDGIAYSRAQLTRAPFLDLARVEVLRGPQNILYGKNSIAGALSLVSAKPGQEREGMVSALYEPDHGEKVLDAVLSGPLTDTLGARVALRKREFDGYIENLTLNRDEPAREESTFRAILDWAATPDLSAMLKFELGKFNVDGRQIEITNDQPSTNPNFGGANYSQILAGAFGADPSVTNTELDYKRTSNGDYSDNRTRNFTLNVDYSVGGGTLSFIAGFLTYEFDELCDCDFTGAPVFSVMFEEEYDQFSQELRWVSEAGGTFEHIGGIYHQKSELDFYDAILIDSPIIPEAVRQRVFAQTGSAAAAQAARDAIANTTTPRYFNSDSDLWSFFWQTTWNATDRFRTTLGVRYSREDKEGSRSLDVADLNGVQKPFTPSPVGVDGVLAGLFKIERHDLDGEQNENQLAPSLNFQYDFTDDIMGYFTATKGYKSGGFDARSNASPSLTDGLAPIAGSFEYGEEEAKSFEVGTKSSFFNGRLELNLAAFYTEYDDLQVSIFDGTLGFNVGNAGAAETKGIELDGRVAVTEQLTMSFALAFLDFEFTDFENGQCYQGQTPDSVGPGGTPFCDYEGMTNQYVADYSGNLAFDFRQPLSGNLEFRAVTDLVFTDDYNSSQNLDPSQEQDGYVKVNMRLALANLKQGWEVALVGKNLTDEEVVSYSNDTPLANSSFGSIGHYSFIERPRSVALQVTLRW